MNDRSFSRACAGIAFKPADIPVELDQILALNHRVFAEEIAQHAAHPSGRLVDRFHESNQYFIAVRNGVVLGMISAHGGPEFSVTRRLPDPGILDGLARPMEVRLLAIERGERNRMLLAGLLWQVYEFAAGNGYSHLLISGLAQRERMYRKLGFRALGPSVPEGEATFVPMMLPLEGASARQRARIALHGRRWKRNEPPSPVSLMPGPVAISPRIAGAFAQPPISHRSASFLGAWERVRGRLNALLNDFAEAPGAPALEAALFPGGGTLANDVIAANLRAIFGRQRGLVLSNGEFGERLANQARRSGLAFHHLAHPWGEPWATADLAKAFAERPAWVWAVQLETSTGVLNDVESLLTFAAAADASVALDCVSSLGAVPIPGDRSHILFLSGVSGKAFGSYAGLAFVGVSRAGRDRLTKGELCPTFDLLRMVRTRGPVSTIASATLFALERALDDSLRTRELSLARYTASEELGRYVRRELRALGITPLARERDAAPVITTFPLPYPDFAQTCLDAGFEIAHCSGYLPPRGWGQIATMGHLTERTLAPLFEHLAQKKRGSQAAAASLPSTP